MSEEQERTQTQNGTERNKDSLDQQQNGQTVSRDSDLHLSSIEIRSDEVQEIMGYIPNWIIRWGITLIFIVIMIFLVGSFFFKYPDVIYSTITVTTKNPPAAIKARTTGKIQQLKVKNTQDVKANQLLAILENACNYDQLLELKEKLDALKNYTPHFDPSETLQLGKNYRLGMLQPDYSLFLKSYSDYRYFIRLNFHQTKIDSIQQQILRYKVLYETSKRQTTIMEQEFALSKENFERSKSLYKDEIISRKEFEAAKSSFLQQEYALEGAKSNLANQRIQLAQLDQSILDLQLQYKEQKKQLELSLNQAYDNLNSQIAQWEQTYLLKSPIEGTVVFTKFWSTNQNVSAGDTVITVIPFTEKDPNGKHIVSGKELIGKVVLPIQGSGKVKVGQHVNIKFMNYPHIDFGMVKGVVTSKSMVAADNSYVLEVSLPNGLKTSYGEILEFTQEMQGSAEIITDDIRLIERVFKPIKSILERM